MAVDKITMDSMEFHYFLEAIVRSLSKAQAIRVSQLRGYTKLEKHLMLMNIELELSEAVAKVWAEKKFSRNGRAR